MSLLVPVLAFAGCASAPRALPPPGRPGSTANPPADQPFADRPPGPIAGLWRVTCRDNEGEVIELTVDRDKAVGRVADPGTAARYGFKKGEEIFRLTVDAYGEWAGQVRWRGISGAEHWDAIRFVASADLLNATLTNEACYRNMPRVR